MSKDHREYKQDPFQSMDDVALWQLFRNGNNGVFELIYNRYVNLLANYGRRICSDDETLKDAIQDLFIDLWKNRTNLGSTNSIQYYLVKALRRNLVKKLKAARKQVYTSDDPIGFELSPEMILINNESDRKLKEQLHESLNTLTCRQKEVIYLRFYCGMDFANISKIMGVNPQSAYNTVYRVLKVLREQMLHKIPILLIFLLQG
ncbi:MAG: DNA-directed RNA polymerase sigma-70 factor [Cyclobacteriaceae bacterium]|nr:MAG: DNA-directed RNA polymerase sigma-70 factor [Cyclobacteriaceae bacterium]